MERLKYEFTLFIKSVRGLGRPSNALPYTANISSRKIFVVFEVHRSSSKFLSSKVAAAPSLPSHS